MSPRALVIDDDPSISALIEKEVADAGVDAIVAAAGREGLRRLEEDEPDVVILDLHLPDMAGTSVLREIRARRPALPVIVLTVEGTVDAVVECMRLGATDYVLKPFDRLRLSTALRNAVTQATLRRRLETLAGEVRGSEGFATIAGESPAIRAAVDMLARAAGSTVTVLLEGETGTGKELAARAIHAESPRRTGPFVGVNCAAIPRTLVESELFGHEKGAFTGAAAARPGYFERADGGTIFLDEIGEIGPEVQVKLLRVIQERAIERLGAARERRVDVRVIAATVRDLKAEAARGGFREDLYYRLAVFPVRLPPLREREGDVAIIAPALLARLGRRHGRPAPVLSGEALRLLERQPWPGNVRQLENVLERALVLEPGPAIPEGLVLRVLDLDRPPPALAAPAEGARGPDPAGAILPLEEEERRIIARALEATGGSVAEAAKRLGVSRNTIYRKLERPAANELPAGRSREKT